jgi:hypothetical protein
VAKTVAKPLLKKAWQKPWQKPLLKKAWQKPCENRG